jgi:hypothetical protein
MPFTETVEIRGHLLDTGVLSRCLDDVRSLGGDYVIERFEVGKDHEDESYARIRVGADAEDELASVLMRRTPRSPARSRRPCWCARSRRR